MNLMKLFGIVIPRRAPKVYPDPFVRAPDPDPVNVGWYRHDGGACPVTPETRICIPAGTYHSKDGCHYFTAGSREWDNRKVPHLRDEIDRFAVIDHLPFREERWRRNHG